VRLSKAASQRVTRLGGVLARRRPPSAWPSSRRMPEPNTGDRNSCGSCVHEFRTAKLRRGTWVFAHDPGAARTVEDYYNFPMSLIFEQSSIIDADRDGGRKLVRLRRGWWNALAAMTAPATGSPHRTLVRRQSLTASTRYGVGASARSRPSCFSSAQSADGIV